MKSVVLGVIVGAALVEVVALFIRMNVWRRRANALEHVALTYADTTSACEKEKLIVNAGWNILGLSVYFSGVLTIFFLLLGLLPHEVNLKQGTFILVTSVVLISYAILRAYLKERRAQAHATSDSTDSSVQNYYSRISRWLHWMALEISTVQKISFDLEKAIFLKMASKDPRLIDRPVYVMGLARSGTTVVLEVLEKTGQFHSPTYRDMPFVLCPNLWKSLTRRLRLQSLPSSRAHKDGIMFGFDSPESFEEVFWRSAGETMPGPTLAYSPIDQMVLDDFAAYRSLSVFSAVTHKPKNEQAAQTLRYLSKNNNSVMRLRELSSQPNSQIVLIIRDPLATAWSLYWQHQRFMQIQSEDEFVRAYMRWLGHHEFGQGHKPLAIGEAHLNGLDPSQPDYWLAYWLGIYEYLWSTFTSFTDEQRARIAWVSHEAMCDAPEQQLACLFEYLQINESPKAYSYMLRPHKEVALHQHFDVPLVQRALALHKETLSSLGQ